MNPVPVERFTVQDLSEARHIKTSVLPSPFRSPVKMGPSEPQAPVHLCWTKPLPVDRLTVQDLSESRHIKTSVLPSPFRSPVKMGPSDPHAPVHLFWTKPLGLGAAWPLID